MEIDRRTLRAWSMMGPTGLYGVIMEMLAEKNKNLYVVTADLCSFSGLDRFQQKYPERLYNVGIAEQNMIGVAGGLASEGLDVFAATYASFISTRALDQVRINAGYMNIPLKLVGLTAGLSSGILGATHMAVEDVAIMRGIPNIVILSPADCLETQKCLEAAIDCSNPVYIRLSGSARMPMVYTEDYEFQIGCPIYLKGGEDITILATGSMVFPSLKAAEELEEKGIHATVVNVHTLKPFEEALIEKALDRKLIVTVEEHYIEGGLGSIVAEKLSEYQMHPKLLRIGIDNYYPEAASYPYLMEKNGLTKEAIIHQILEFLV